MHPQRKPNRLHDFDYSRNGAYFITICTEKRLETLCNIVGDGLPVPQIMEDGIIVERYINSITEKYHTIIVDKYVIMPNHIHLLLIIQNNEGTGNPSPTIGNVIGWFKYQTTKEINEKYYEIGNRLWQRSFHDHIIRNEKDYQKIWTYIDENPLNWKKDCFNSLNHLTK